MATSLSLIYFISAILLLTKCVQGRPGGGAFACCTNIAPEHSSLPPSSDPLPYSIDLSGFTDGEYIPGATYQSRKYKSCISPTTYHVVHIFTPVTLSGSTSNPDFIGFMIQGRVFSNDLPAGEFEFSSDEDQSQPQCNDTAATHVNNTEKTSVILTWTAPAAGTGAIRFRFAFVDMFTLFWSHMYTAKIQEGTPDTDPPSDSTDSTRTPPSCEEITGLPECNEKLCNSQRNRYKQCFIVKDSCTNRCQVSRCLTCEYVRKPVKPPQRPHCERCKTYYDRACWYRYYKCRYNNYRTYGYHSRYYRSYYYYYHHQTYERVFKCFTQCKDYAT